MTASIAQNRIGSLFDRINLIPDFDLPNFYPQPIIVPVNPGIGIRLDGSDNMDDSLI
jgi:hypothetical protein